MAGTSSMLIKILADVTDAKAKMKELDASMHELGNKISNVSKTTNTTAQQFGASLSKMGSAVAQVGGAMTVGITLPLVAIGTAALDTAIKFETAFTGVKKTVDEGANGVNGAVTSFATLEAGIIDLSSQLGVSKNDIAEIMQIAGQLGIRGNEALLGFTETVAKLNITTGESPEFLASMIGKLAAISGLNVAEDIDKLGAVITALGNTTATTERDIIRFGVRAAAAGRILGMTLPDILAISAAFESTGTKAERGGTAFTKILLSIQAEAAGAAEVTSKYGKELENNSKELTTWEGKLQAAKEAQAGLNDSSPADEVQRITAELATAQEMVDLYKASQEDLTTVMTTATNKGGGFAELLGLTDKKFADLVKNSKDGGTVVFEMFINKMGELTNAGASVQGVMAELGLTDARLVQAVMSLSQANTDAMVTTSDLTSALATARAAWAESTGDFSNAMDREVITKLNTVASQWNIFKELINETMLIFTKQGMGGIQDFLKGLNLWLEDFNEKLKVMPQEKIEKIVNGLIALAAAGPALIIVGNGMNIIGKAMVGWGGFVKMVKTVFDVAKWKAGFAAMSGGMSSIVTTLFVWGSDLAAVFGVTITTVAGGVAVALGAIALAIAGVVLLWEGLKYALSDSIEKVDLFGKGVSDLTEKKVKPFLKSMQDMDTYLLSVDWADRIISPSDVENIKGRLHDISKTIIEELDADKNESLAKLNPLKYMMDADKYNKLISDTTNYYDGMLKKVQDGEARINAIMQKASDEKRQLHADEKYDIGVIQAEIQNIGITLLSETEEESLIIMGRIKDNSIRLSAEQMAGMIQNAAKTRDETIKAAEDQYYSIMGEAGKMRDVGAITQAEYIAIQESAWKTKNSTVEAAEKQYGDIYNAAATKMPEINHLVDKESGDIRSKLDAGTRMFNENMGKWFEETKVNIGKTLTDSGKAFDKFILDSETNMETFSVNVGTWWDTTRVEWAGNLDKIALNMDTFWTNLWSKPAEWFKKMGDNWDAFTTFFSVQMPIALATGKENFNTFTSGVGTFFKTMFNGIISGFNGMLRTMNKIKFTFPEELKWIGMGNIAGKTIGFNFKEIPLLARGGMPSAGQAFVAGENGKELIGQHKGRTTVMPLENTSFVSAIGRAVSDGVVNGMRFVNMGMTRAINAPSMDSVGDQASSGDFLGTLVRALKEAGVGTMMVDGKLVTDNVSGHMYTNTRRGKY